MINFAICLIISVLVAMGISIALVEKSDKYPLDKVKAIVKGFLLKLFGEKFTEVVECTVCTSFWVTFFSDIVVWVYSGGAYFFWPFSGFVTVGIVWIIIELINKEIIQIGGEQSDEENNNDNKE
jgi:hypothetical protein